MVLKSGHQGLRRSGPRLRARLHQRIQCIGEASGIARRLVPGSPGGSAQLGGGVLEALHHGFITGWRRDIQRIEGGVQQIGGVRDQRQFFLLLVGHEAGQSEDLGHKRLLGDAGGDKIRVGQ